MNENRMRFYIGALLVINILFFGVQYYFNYKYINKFQVINKNYASVQQKEILLFQLKDYVSQLESQILLNGIFSLDDVLLKCNNKKIAKIFLEIKNILDILEYGGKVNEKIVTNLAKYKGVKKDLYIQKETHLLYLKDIKATLLLLPKFIKRINRQIVVRNAEIKKHLRLKYYLKLIPSIIYRTKENINNYLFFTEQKLKSLENKKEKLLDDFFHLHLILFLVLIVINLIIFYLIILDIQKINQELRKRLYYDKLTGLKNRIKLKEELESNKGILFILDIDNFGTYNELYGNKLGDEVLKNVVDILLKNDNISQDNLYRIGSDEFAIWFEKVDIKEEIDSLKSIFKNSILEIENIKIENLSFKIGVSDVADLLDNAFIALKLAKQLNKTYHIFSVEDLTNEQNRIKNVLFWTQKIQEAIDNDLIVPVFQPIVDKMGNVVKYEMLLRIKDKDKLIPPFFLEIAMQNNQYFDISKIMFSKAIEYINNKKLQLSFNINYIDFENEEMYEFYKQKVMKCAYPNFLTFEILESGAIKNYELLNEKMRFFESLGVKLAIDDFGSGYSNYKHILELKPSFLKIDGSLIKNILEDKNSLYIVESIQDFANKTGVLTVAEFVENEAIFNKLKEIGINYFQGYYFSKPILL